MDGEAFTSVWANRMHLHYFQHTPSEGPGEIASWARHKGHLLSATRWDLGELPPALEEIDWLILMGGPMNIYEHRNHPWLVQEKQFLAEAIASGKTVLGICLGAQLIADALGGTVFQNPEIEIGWFPIEATPPFADPDQARWLQFPSGLTPLHWHGDTFSLPSGAVLLAESAGCKHQAFAWGDRVVAVQFHLEVGFDDVARFLEGEPNELGTGRFIQKRDEILQGAPINLPEAHAALMSLLETMERVTNGG